ncbi:MAG: ribonuclease Y [bacterium]|nr:ribonuclease Y [bacterium]
MEQGNIILPVLISAILCGILGYYGRRHFEKIKTGSAEELSKKIIDEAKEEAQKAKKEAILEAKDEVYKEKTEFERESRNRRLEIERLEAKLRQKEENLDQKVNKLEKKEREIQLFQDTIANEKKEVTRLKLDQIKQLESLSNLSREEAKKLLMQSIESEIRHEANKMIKTIEDEAKDVAEKKAKWIICNAIQRCSADQVAETTVSVVSLPSDEMKGRIIGREGRNIRTIENLTGVDLIIDDTPEAVILSGFDPVKREVAKLSLQRLITDGRIHPARIEEVINKVQTEVEQSIKEEGEKSTFDLGVHGINSELIYLLGKLKFRTSYGQNVLHHSIEVAQIAGVMAGELNVDVKLVKRAGLLHDLGKSVDSTVEGPHASIGADLARKYGESADVIHAIAAHHGEIEPKTVEAILIQASDAVSAARPGVRKESLENYIRRLEKLEAIASSFRGVEKCYAIQAGREIRVIASSNEVDEAELAALGREIAKKIEDELEYPGQIRVTMIRETREIVYAK